jgi:ParB-like chromosome segregation protein Spo0J
MGQFETVTNATAPLVASQEDGGELDQIPRSVPLAAGEVPIAQLCLGGSPRLRDVDDQHVRMLASTGAVLPPILVHRDSMRVIDGMHRISAARLRGERRIPVRFFEGTEADAFVEAVRANTTHGKPLALAEREAAARTILQTHADWSDRAIAHACGLSSKTLAAIRARTAEVPQSDARVGRDGRIRPVNAEVGRLRAAELLKEHPGASLRDVARAAGVSPGTVRSVRSGLDNGVTPLRTQPEPMAQQAPEQPQPQCHVQLADLERDAALASTESGRALVLWLVGHHVDNDDWQEFVGTVPVGRLYEVADFVRGRAKCWMEFAEALEARAAAR